MPERAPKLRYRMESLQGRVIFHEQEGGFAAPAMEIDGRSLDRWLCEALGVPVTDRGSPDPGAQSRECLIVVYQVERDV